MNSFKTVEEAIKDAPEKAHYVIEIEPGQPGVERYIRCSVPARMLANILKNKPMPEIKRVIGDVADLDKIKREAAQAKLEANVPGLAALLAALNDECRYHDEFEQMMGDENNDGARPPRKPAANSEDLKAQYPVAAAYIKAESWHYADHYAKSAAGRKAMERIAAGQDHVQVLAEMESEWSAHCQEHIWD